MTNWMGYKEELFWGEKDSQQSFEYVEFDRPVLYSNAGMSCKQFGIWIDIYALKTLEGIIIRILYYLTREVDEMS